MLVLQNAPEGSFFPRLLFSPPLSLGPIVAAWIGELAAFVCVMFGSSGCRVPTQVPASTFARSTCTTCGGRLTSTTSYSLGSASNDPFLAYRSTSTESLAVPLMPGLAAAAITILVWLGAWIAPRMDRHLRAPLVALPVAASILVLNNYWGFNQEPYRFWMQMNILSLLLLSVVVPAVFVQWYAHRRHYPRRLPAAYLILTMAGSSTWRAWVICSAWERLRQGPRYLFRPGSDQAVLQSLTQDLEGLVATDPCIDPQERVR